MRYYVVARIFTKILDDAIANASSQKREYQMWGYPQLTYMIELLKILMLFSKSMLTFRQSNCSKAKIRIIQFLGVKLYNIIQYVL